MCGRFFSRQRSQSTRVVAVVFHWLRRERVLERDIFRLGTGTTYSFRRTFWVLLTRRGSIPHLGTSPQIEAVLQVSPPGIDHLVSVI